MKRYLFNIIFILAFFTLSLSQECEIGYSEIDNLRNKFKDDKYKFKVLEEINSYIEEKEKIYQKAS